MPMPKKPRTKCLSCGKITARPSYKYCSNICQHKNEYEAYIDGWKKGLHTGLQGHGVVSGYIKRYLRIKFDDKCCLCGWAEINLILQKRPLIADHIDGNWRNNQESNLRLVCPNCDSLSPTYAGLNRKKGRGNRKRSKRALEAFEFIKKKPK